MQPVIYVDLWLLLGFTIASVVFAIGIIYKLLMYVSKITIDGIYQQMELCQSDLEIKIEKAHSCANNACNRVEVIEHTLMDNGVKMLRRKSDVG